MVNKGGTEADGSWFCNGAEGSAIAGRPDAARFRVVAVLAFCGTIPGDGIFNTGGDIRGNGGGGAVLAVRHAGATIATVFQIEKVTVVYIVDAGDT